MFLEIGGTAADDAADIAKPYRHKAAVQQGTDPQGDIDMVVNEVHHPIRQHQPDVDLGIGRQELVHQRQDVKAAEDDGRGNDKVSPGRAVFA